ncbi:protein-L-isoaspartate and D-aspartate O-methyltransferase [Bernardetia litoralis DSM 6794]|uniref:Protein-L-isoaspartate O-methyltransferase n=1 Tax=Bernardetia litoralis (strain ATCC 23117 / DSM 6794 / NBRC 15988 / NCIMB 1366 / Fx l1 / Sio-4) TaxID=880071 RepID=I4AQ24_BERLS|nr:protein-L-isoaspartate O-methyltransferase [Bernardetia litoralis]AFM06059.1 protein-L-isoaspartate and D-aspartate O-methyltransferase [Bernardetia litoralis DSM 6794]
MQKDSYKHQGLRRQLVDEIIKMGIKDEQVLNAILTVPRHFFMDSAFLEHAYQNKAFSIGEGQTISQPYTVAYQSELLNLKDLEISNTVKKNAFKILEIGTGSGYQAAILAYICKNKNVDITSIEYHKNIHQKAQQTLENLYTYLEEFNFDVLKWTDFVQGDGSKGFIQNAPYDRILVTAATPNSPQSFKEWFNQLNIGGQIIVPVGNRKNQIMCRYTKKDEKTIEQENFGGFRFVPLLGEKGFDNIL